VKGYVLDANAIIAFLQGGDQENALRVRRLVQSARDGEADLFISAIGLGEVFHTLRKSRSEASATQLISTLRGIANIIEVNPDTATRQPN
jgi:predicted nucleic acid-binding protein